MKKSNDADDVKVNRRSSDKVYFESILLQKVYDRIDFLKDESKEILQDLDLNRFEEVDVREFGENTLDQISDIFKVLLAILKRQPSTATARIFVPVVSIKIPLRIGLLSS